MVHTPWWRRATSRSSSANRAAARNESRRWSIGVEPACAAWPVKTARWRSTPTRAEHGADRQALGLEHRPLLDVQLEVGPARPSAGSAPRAPGRRRRRARAARPASRRPSASVRSRTLSGSSVPAAAERAEQAAAEARALLVGPVDQGHACTAACPARPRARAAPRARPSRRARRRASRRSAPSRRASRRPRVSGRSPSSRAQTLPASSVSTVTGSSSSQLAHQAARRDPLVRTRPGAGPRRGRRSGRPARAGCRSPGRLVAHAAATDSKRGMTFEP